MKLLRLLIVPLLLGAATAHADNAPSPVPYSQFNGILTEAARQRDDALAQLLKAKGDLGLAEDQLAATQAQVKQLQAQVKQMQDAAPHPGPDSAGHATVATPSSEPGK